MIIIYKNRINSRQYINIYNLRNTIDYNTGFEEKDHFFFFETNFTITHNKLRLMTRDLSSRCKFICESEYLYGKLAYFFAWNSVKICLYATRLSSVFHNLFLLSRFFRFL